MCCDVPPQNVEHLGTEPEVAIDPQPQLHRRGLRPRLTAPFGGLPTTFWWLWLGTLINRTGTFIEPFFVLYLTGPRHVSVTTAGVVLTVWGVGSVISQPIGGVLTDRFGRRTTLGISLTATAIALFALSFARQLWLLSTLVFVLGVVADMYRPAATAAIADVVDEPERTRAYALQFWAINLGFSIAATSAGLLVHFGFGLLFVLDALTTFAFGMIALRFVPETRPEHHDAPARILDPIRLFRRDRLLLAATVLILIYAILYTQVNVTLPLAIAHAGLGTSAYGYVIAVNGILIIVLQPITLRWLSSFSRRRTMPVGVGLVGIGIALSGLCHAAWEFAATVVIWTVGEVATAGSFQALVASLAPAHMRGRYAGAIGLAWGASGLLAPLLGAAGFALSPGLLWTGCLVAGVISSVGQFWLLGELDKRTAAEIHRPTASRVADVNASMVG